MVLTNVLLCYQVIYGDTDSVMVNFYVESVQKGMEIGADAAAYVSEKFIKPIKIEFEKVFGSKISPFLFRVHFTRNVL